MNYCTEKPHRAFLGIVVILALSLVNPNKPMAQRPGQQKAQAHHKKEQHKKSHHKKAHSKQKAHYHYRHLPRRGVVIEKLPTGTVVLKHKGSKLHFHKGVFYKPKGAGGFTVVRAPIGMRIKILPVGHQRIVVKKKPYVYYYGSFYAKSNDSEGYEVVEAPIGAEVDALPEGYEQEEIEGVVYYTLDDARYMEKDIDGEPVYQVVK